jgi:hypothetical protein
MNTTALPALKRPTLPGAATFGQRIASLVRRAEDWLLTAQPEPAHGVRELLALADRYEATMPGFAADLRAAAMSDRNGQA